MKINILLFSFICLSVSTFAQSINGWEFLVWHCSKDSVDNVLKVKNIHPEEHWPLEACFQYNEMRTWFTFDSLNRLSQVHQRNEFSVVQLKEAKECYKAQKDRLMQKYGRPVSYQNNRKKQSILIQWKLPNNLSSG